MATPASVYQPSWRPYPERLPELEYPDRMLPRRVQSKGDIGLLGRQLFLSETLGGRDGRAWKSHDLSLISAGAWSAVWAALELDWLERTPIRGARGRAGGSTDLRRKRSGGASSARPTGSLPRRPPSVSGNGSPSVQQNLLLVQPLNCYLCGWGKVLPRCWAVPGQIVRPSAAGSHKFVAHPTGIGRSLPVTCVRRWSRGSKSPRTGSAWPTPGFRGRRRER